MEPTIRVNLGPTLTRLKAAAAKAKRLEPVLEGPVTNAVHELFGQRFSTEGRYGGDAWAPLSAGTLAAKRRIGRANMGILRRYNRLWASLVKRSAPEGYRIVSDRQLIVGTSVPYAPKHQLGEGTPRRLIVPETVPKADTERWAKLVADYAAGG